MSIALEERITQHATYTNIDRVLQLLDEMDSSNLNTNKLQMLGRILETFTFLKEALDKVDPWLVSTTSLTNMNNTINQIASYLTNFRNDKNEQHLTNIFNHLENLLPYFTQFLVPKTPDDIEGIRSSVISFRKSVGQHLSNVEREAVDTSATLKINTEKLNELTGAIENQKGRIDSVISDFQNQFLNAQTNRNEEFNDFLKKAEDDFKENLSSYNDGFEKLVTTQKESFDTLNEGFEQQTENQQQSFDTLIDDLKSKVQSELDQIKEMNQKAEKILGIMSMKGLAQGYQKIANSEGNKAFVWNAISILSILGVLWFGYKFIILHEGTMTWTALISRVVLTGVGITLFTYCAKQATNHRNEERRNRKIELELASLDPYLKDLEETEQKKVKQSLVDKYFGVELPNTQTQQGQTQIQQNALETVSSNPQLLQAIAEKVTQIISTK
ncbi:hypothetical protein ABE41_009280 [Fictibacillus arsenicus]|uniref:Uncharacterized protein n=1 Tax=Fictibacillus arsenicus TaxID=255247 RepID=A0A1B1Z4E2_9BACL|nr:hypothetical protein [Fictibacillus arsenicus]ANX12199.1 hypothetical protein ABE41_009280 [Fictibacillus arsenicus]